MPIPGLTTVEPDGAMPWPLVLVEGEEHSGKAMPLHAAIVTPTGWTTHGDVAVGDLVVGADGHPTEVLAVYDRGVRPVYRLTLSDGATVEACDEHLWSVQTSNDRHRQYSKGPKKGQRNERPHRVLTTAQVRELVLDGTVVHLPMASPVQYSAAGELPLDPYALGLLLGDGTLSKSCTPGFTSGDPELIAALAGLLPGGDVLTASPNPITVGIKGGATTAALRALGLMGSGSAMKLLPEAYLRASVAERVALLQGLLDTDGGMEGPSVMFTTVSPLLASGVRVLVESLGGTAAVGTKRPFYRDKDGERREGKLAYRLTIRLPEGMCPFRLGRKVQRWAACRPASRSVPRRTVREVEYVGDEPVRCIQVAAADHLYLTDHFVVTHNTWDLVVFAKQCEALGEVYWIPLDEGGHARMYGGRLPGKPFELVKLKDGSHVELIDAIRKIKAHAQAQHDAGEKPVVMIIDSISGVWSGLHDWVNDRHRQTKKAQAILRDDPNADVGRAGRNLWNDAEARWRSIVRELKTFPGLVIVTARGKEISATDPDTGQPAVDAAKKPIKTWSLETHKEFKYYVDVWLRKRREEGNFVVSVRSVEHGKKPGSKEAKEAEPILDARAEGREIEWLLFDILGLDPTTAYVNDFIESNAGTGFTDEELAQREQELQGRGQSQEGRVGPNGQVIQHPTASRQSKPTVGQVMAKIAEITDPDEPVKDIWKRLNGWGMLGMDSGLDGLSLEDVLLGKRDRLLDDAKKAKTGGDTPVSPVVAAAQTAWSTAEPPAAAREAAEQAAEADRLALPADADGPTEPDPADKCRRTPARAGIEAALHGLGVDDAGIARHFGRDTTKVSTANLRLYVEQLMAAATAQRAEGQA